MQWNYQNIAIGNLSNFRYDQHSSDFDKYTWMTMKNNILQRLTAFTLTLGLSLTALHPVYANTTKIEKNLQANYPDVKVESITQSPLKGIYEVNMGGRMIYTNEDAQYVLVGDLLDLKNKKNLTH